MNAKLITNSYNKDKIHIPNTYTYMILKIVIISLYNS